MLRLRKRFPGISRAVGDARREVVDFAALCGFSEAACFDIETAVGEACSNAVEHGYTRTRGFSIACGFADGALTVEIRDFHAGAPLSSASKASRLGHGKTEGGLGLLLISALTDEWHLRPANSGGSILTFRVGHERTPAMASRVALSATQA